MINSEATQASPTENTTSAPLNPMEHYISVGEKSTKDGHTSEAIHSFKKALEIDPKNISCHGRLGDIFLADGKMEEAIHHFNTIISEHNNPPDWSYIGMGNALEKNNDFIGALIYLGKALALRPENDNLKDRITNIHLTNETIKYSANLNKEHKKTDSQATELMEAFDIAISVGKHFHQQLNWNKFEKCYHKARLIYLKWINTLGFKNAEIINPALTPLSPKGRYGCINLINPEGIYGWLLDIGHDHQNHKHKIAVLLNEKTIGYGISSGYNASLHQNIGHKKPPSFHINWNSIELFDSIANLDNEERCNLLFRIDGSNEFLMPEGKQPTIHELMTWIEQARLTPSITKEQIFETLAPNDEQQDPILVQLDDDLAFQYKAIKPHFDQTYYTNKYPLTKSSGDDPVVHFLVHGWKQHLNPNPNFDTEYYIQANPDVKQANVCPFYHYLVSGRFEGRPPRKYASAERNILNTIETLSNSAKDWISNSDKAPVIEPPIIKLILEALLSSSTHIAFSISHDNPKLNVGGIQLVVQREMADFSAAGGSYINLFPEQPLPILDSHTPAEEFRYGITINGSWLGYTSQSVICKILSEHTESLEKRKVSLIIHSLLGSNINHVIELYKTLKPTNCYFWLHDYFAICPNYTLLRNRISHCGAPPVHSQACNICIFKEDRLSHLPKITQLFETIPFKVLSPSPFAANLFKERSKLDFDKLTIQPHGSWANIPESDINHNETINFNTIRVAYLGQLVAHKGWEDFSRLVEHYGSNHSFQFFVFGVHDPSHPLIRYIPVHVKGDNSEDMIQALEAEKINVAFIGSKWPETFCFTAHEALSAGSILVTHIDSGNVVDLVAKAGFGLIYRNLEELIDLLSPNHIKKLIARHHKQNKQKFTLHSFPLGTSDQNKPDEPQETSEKH